MKIINSILCPITQKIMRLPVVACDGYTYEREAIERHLAVSKTSFVTHQEMQELLIPNISLLDIINDYLSENQLLLHTNPEIDSVYLPNSWRLEMKHVIEENDMDNLKKLIDRDCRLAIKNIDENKTAYHYACECGSLQLIRELNNYYHQMINIDRPSFDFENWQPKILNELLFKAVCENDYKTAKEALALGANPAMIKYEGGLKITPLFRACIQSESIVKLLLKNPNVKAAINVPISSSGGWGNLHEACKHGHIEIVKELIENKADIEDKTNWGGTPIWAACQRGGEMHPMEHLPKKNHITVIDYLIKQGASLKPLNNGWSLLQEAFKYGCYSQAEYLLTKNLDSFKIILDDEGQFLFYLIHMGYVKSLRLLLKYYKLNKANINFYYAKNFKHNFFYYSYANKKIIHHHGEIIQEEKDELGKWQHYTPLIFAVICSHLSQDMRMEIISALLENGADVENKCTCYGSAPLNYAAAAGNNEIVKLLLRYKANPNTTNGNDNTPIYHAAWFGLAETVGLLAESADVNAANKQGYTPLHIAAEKNKQQVIKVLSKAGAFLYSKTISGISPLEIAQEKQHEAIVQMLNSYQEKIQRLFQTAVNGEKMKLITLCKQDEIHIATQNDAKQTILHVASIKGHTDLVNYLLSLSKIDINTQDNEGFTSLMYACQHKHTNIVDLLLKYTPNLDLINKKGLSAYKIAFLDGNASILRSLQNYYKLYKLELPETNIASEKANLAIELLDAAKQGNLAKIQDLIKLDVSVNIVQQTTDKFNITPLFQACKYDHPKLVQLFLKEGANPNFKLTENGWTCLHESCNRGLFEVVNILLNKSNTIDIEASSSRLLSPVYFTVLRCTMHPDSHKQADDYIKVLKLMIKAKAQLTPRQKGYSILHRASKYGAYQQIIYLLDECKMDIESVHATSNDEYTPLAYAVEYGKEKTIEELLTRGANYAYNSCQQNTLLHFAAKGKQARVLQDLISRYQLDINARNSDGNTPLLMSIEKEDLNSVNVLLGANAYIYTKNNTGITPLSLAATFDDKRIIDLLKERYELIKQLFMAIEEDNQNEVMHLLSDGLSIDSQNEKKQTLLMIACKQNDIAFMTYISNNYHPDYNLRDINGETALFYACRTGDSYTIKCLLSLSQNIDCEVKNNDGHTASAVATHAHVGSFRISNLLDDYIRGTYGASDKLREKLDNDKIIIQVIENIIFTMINGVHDYFLPIHPGGTLRSSDKKELIFLLKDRFDAAGIYVNKLGEQAKILLIILMSTTLQNFFRVKKPTAPFFKANKTNQVEFVVSVGSSKIKNNETFRKVIDTILELFKQFIDLLTTAQSVPDLLTPTPSAPPIDDDLYPDIP